MVRAIIETLTYIIVLPLKISRNKRYCTQAPSPTTTASPRKTGTNDEGEKGDEGEGRTVVEGAGR